MNDMPFFDRPTRALDEAMAKMGVTIAATKVRMRRDGLRRAVPYFLLNREEMHRRLQLPVDADERVIMQHLRAGRSRAGHWSFSYARHIGLRQAYIATRYERLLKRAYSTEQVQ